MDENLVHKFGYAEMYEWANPEMIYVGRFVQFNGTDKIELCNDPYQVIGVTTVNRVALSDNPDEWPNKFMGNEFGDTYVQNKHVARAEKFKDEQDNFEFIRTFESFESNPLISENYDQSLSPYVSRLYRPEWQQVTILGKCIVEDDGTLQPGMYCTVYDGEDQSKFGIAIKAHRDSQIKYYVISRYSEKTCLILFK